MALDKPSHPGSALSAPTRLLRSAFPRTDVPCPIAPVRPGSTPLISPCLPPPTRLVIPPLPRPLPTYLLRSSPVQPTPAYPDDPSRIGPHRPRSDLPYPAAPSLARLVASPLLSPVLPSSDFPTQYNGSSPCDGAAGNNQDGCNATPTSTPPADSSRSAVTSTASALSASASSVLAVLTSASRSG